MAVLGEGLGCGQKIGALGVGGTGQDGGCCHWVQGGGGHGPHLFSRQGSGMPDSAETPPIPSPVTGAKPGGQLKWSEVGSVGV